MSEHRTPTLAVSATHIGMAVAATIGDGRQLTVNVTAPFVMTMDPARRTTSPSTTPIATATWSRELGAAPKV